MPFRRAISLMLKAMPDFAFSCHYDFHFRRQLSLHAPDTDICWYERQHSLLFFFFFFRLCLRCRGVFPEAFR